MPTAAAVIAVTLVGPPRSTNAVSAACPGSTPDAVDRSSPASESPPACGDESAVAAGRAAPDPVPTAAETGPPPAASECGPHPAGPFSAVARSWLGSRPHLQPTLRGPSPAAGPAATDSSRSPLPRSAPAPPTRHRIVRPPHSHVPVSLPSFLPSRYPARLPAPSSDENHSL